MIITIIIIEPSIYFGIPSDIAPRNNNNNIIYNILLWGWKVPMRGELIDYGGYGSVGVYYYYYDNNSYYIIL